MAHGDGPKTIGLRYAATCATCGVDMPAGTQAVWNKAAGGAFCQSCGTVTALSGNSSPSAPESPSPGRTTATAPPPVADAELSDAGRSAQAEFERRHLRREQGLEARWGRLSGIAKLLSDDPQSTKAWARGAEGERRLAAQLARALADRTVFLHDRKVGRANIDHLIVASSGVWVVDAKNYTGRVEYRNVGGWLGPADHRVYVGGRDKTKLVTALGWQVTAVREALGNLDAPVHPALCFTSSDWGWFAKPFVHEGVLVTWTSKMADMIAATGDLGPEQIEQVARRLAQALKPAT